MEALRFYWFCFQQTNASLGNHLRKMSYKLRLKEKWVSDLQQCPITSGCPVQKAVTSLFEGDKDLFGLHLPCYRSPVAPIQVCHKQRKRVNSTEVMVPLRASCTISSPALAHSIFMESTLYLDAHAGIHTNRHPSAGIFYSLFCCFGTHWLP